MQGGRNPGKETQDNLVELESSSEPMGVRLQGNVFRWVCESGLNNKTQVKDRGEKHKI